MARVRFPGQIDKLDAGFQFAGYTEIDYKLLGWVKVMAFDFMAPIVLIVLYYNCNIIITSTKIGLE